MTQEHSSQNDNNIAKHEFNLYLLLPSVLAKQIYVSSGLQKKVNYPILAKLVHKKLSIQVTLVPSECFFY